MSTAAFPPTKTGGYRPPADIPPRTGFGGFNETPEEPYHKVLANSVRQLMTSIKRAAPEELVTLRRLVDQRAAMVEEELKFERMLSTEPLPPLLADLYSLEFLGTEEEPVSTYLRLLSTLDDAGARLDELIAELNNDTAPSDP